MAKALTYQELMEFAKQHYNEGGDSTYECCDENWFNDYVEQFGAITKKRALHMFKIDKEISREIMATAW